MAKFSNRPAHITAPITGTQVPDVRNHEGAPAFSRDAEAALFLLAASNFVTEATFYEQAGARDARFEALVHQVTVEDPKWVVRFGPYLRNTMHMRSASIVLAAEYVKAGGPEGRALVNAVLQRPDEPGEMLAYWQSRHGRKVPQPIKRGVADAARRLYSERAVLKWDGSGRPWRFADVIERTHPKPTAPWQSTLFRYLLDQRHHGDGTIIEMGDAPVILAMIEADRRLLALPEAQRRDMIGSPMWEQAGWSWERLAGWLPGGMDAQAWEAMIPHMGYMALLRNLRNFDQAGISDAFSALVTMKLTDVGEVAKSKQFPYRFFSAYKAVPGLRWAYALERAMGLSLTNVPALRGRTAVMIDVSGSMTHESFIGQFHPGWRKRNPSTLPWELAAIFGVALGLRAEAANVFVYSTQANLLPIPPGEAIVRIVEQIPHLPAFQGGTQTLPLADAIVRETGPYDRLVILTDEQHFGATAGQTAALAQVPRIYTFNMAGYAAGQLPTGEGGRFTFGGLTDAAFDLLPALEGGLTDGHWPF